MQALIGITIAALDSAKVASANAPAQHLDEISVEVRERLEVEKGEWADADEDGGDGGEAISISRSEFDQLLSKGRKAEERAIQKEWNRSHRRRGGTAFKSSQAAIRKDADKDTTDQRHNASAKPVGYIPPHLRGLTKFPKSSPQMQQSEVSGPVSEQMQKRLVIMDDEEYGMW